MARFGAYRGVAPVGSLWSLPVCLGTSGGVAQVACNLWGPKAVETTPRVAHSSTPPCHVFGGGGWGLATGEVGVLREFVSAIRGSALNERLNGGSGNREAVFLFVAEKFPEGRPPLTVGGRNP